MQKEFRVYVRGIVLDENENILLLKKNNDQKIGPGKYMPPGGTLEFGEDAEDTLSREIKEETNLNVKDTRLLDVNKIILENIHWTGVYYGVEVDNIEDFRNMEPEKHEVCDFHDISKMYDFLFSDLIFDYIKGRL